MHVLMMMIMADILRAILFVMCLYLVKNTCNGGGSDGNDTDDNKTLPKGGTNHYSGRVGP